MRMVPGDGTIRLIIHWKVFEFFLLFYKDSKKRIYERHSFGGISAFQICMV